MDDIEVRQAAVDIFAYIVEYSPSMVREFIIQEGNGQEDVSSFSLNLRLLPLGPWFEPWQGQYVDWVSVPICRMEQLWGFPPTEVFIFVFFP